MLGGETASVVEMPGFESAICQLYHFRKVC